MGLSEGPHEDDGTVRGRERLPPFVRGGVAPAEATTKTTPPVAIAPAAATTTRMHLVYVESLHNKAHCRVRGQGDRPYG